MTTRNKQGSPNNGDTVLGVDTGGTFTDLVYFDGATLHVGKRASTPEQPEKAVIAGVQALAGNDQPRIVHGSTVATNAVLEGKLARTVYVANDGLADVLTIGRQARRQLYGLEPQAQPPPVLRELCVTVDQRSAPDGSEVSALTEQALSDLAARIRELAPEAVAINLLYSFFDDTAERRIAEAIEGAVYVSRSSAVLPEYKEYERGIATWLNAALGPAVGRYLGRLREALGDLAVMHGAAGTVAVDQAAEHAVNLLLSGPAAGLLGARFVGELADCPQLLSFDMGGTSTDVASIEGDIALTSEGDIAGYPVAVPMVDMHTIGAGGGSIAYLDAGGVLCVGPASAGAVPGPACYGQGGTEPTVTDANVVLGRLPASTRLGGDMPLAAHASHQAMAGLAQTLGISTEEAADGVIRVANEAMAGALRVISVERGDDPRMATLLCFGGSGGMHVCALAEALGMRHALMPIYAGVLSALGMLVARRTRELSRSVLTDVAAIADAEIEAALTALRQRGETELAAEGIARESLEADAFLDLRYRGQSATLRVAWHGAAQAAEAFHAAHEARYGHRLDSPVELVTVRLSLRGPAPDLPLAKLAPASHAPEPVESTRVHGVTEPVPVYQRADLGAGQRLTGPAVVREQVSTTWLAPDWACTVDAYGNLLLEQKA